ALARSLPESLGEQPRHLQWVALLLFEYGVGADPDRSAVDVDVRTEWRRLGVGQSRDPVRRVIALDPDRSGLFRFQRALALLLPPYERLLAQDLADRGLSTAGAGPVADDEEGVDLGLGSSGVGNDVSDPDAEAID